MMDNKLKALSLFLFANLVSKLLLMYVCSAHCSHYAHMYREGVRRLYFCCTLCSHSVSRCILCILCVFLQVFLTPRTTGLLCWREVEASVRYVYDCIVWSVVCTYMHGMQQCQCWLFQREWTSFECTYVREVNMLWQCVATILMFSVLSVVLLLQGDTEDMQSELTHWSTCTLVLGCVGI